MELFKNDLLRIEHARVTGQSMPPPVFAEVVTARYDHEHQKHIYTLDPLFPTGRMFEMDEQKVRWEHKWGRLFRINHETHKGEFMGKPNVGDLVTFGGKNRTRMGYIKRIDPRCEKNPALVHILWAKSGEVKTIEWLKLNKMINEKKIWKLHQKKSK